MYQKRDGRNWSSVSCNGVNVQMLWDSGASVSVMSEEIWRKIGSPKINDLNVMLAGVFSEKSEKCIGKVRIKLFWNKNSLKER